MIVDETNNHQSPNEASSNWWQLYDTIRPSTMTKTYNLKNSPFSRSNFQMNLCGNFEWLFAWQCFQ